MADTATKRTITLKRPPLRRYWIVYLLVLPAIGYRLIWTGWPLVETVRLSLTDSNLINGTESFVGLRNYRELFADDTFRNSLYVSVAYSVVVVLGTIVFGLGIAHLLARRRRGRFLGRVAVLIPFTIPTVLAAQMWRSMVTNTGSPLNDVLLRLGIIDEPIAWLSVSWSARLIVILASIWRSAPFAAILFIAALSGMPREILDAAQIDGAGAWRKFRHVTLPMIAPVVIVVMIFQAIEALRAFDIVYALTKGGPGTATDVLSYHAYQDMFLYGKSGYGSAQAMVLIAVTVLVVALLSIWLRQRQRRLTA